jgi:C_GCAxxG_C_C family probable redox protein
MSQLKEKKAMDPHSKSHLAVSRFKDGFSCSQAVLSAFSDSYGLDLPLSLKISQPFGGGIAHLGEMCGAVSGALMAIGLKYGRTKAEDIRAREKTYEVVRKFLDRFKDAHNTIICRELLGLNLDTEEGYKKAEEDRLFETLCPKFVRLASEILENLI